MLTYLDDLRAAASASYVAAIHTDSAIRSLVPGGLVVTLRYDSWLRPVREVWAVDFVGW